MKPFISLPIISLILAIASAAMTTEAGATPAYMQYYGAPSCDSCHANAGGPRAGLAAFLASKTPVCSAPQVLQNNVCVTPAPVCTAPQVLQNNVCVTPLPTCTAPQVLQNNSCVTPPPVDTTVRMQTSLGVIDIRLFDADAPSTVANFLSYLDSGAYNNAFIQRSVPGFIVQGGGYVWNGKTKSAKAIVTKPPVANEFNPGHANLRGTIAMAKLDGKPDSATSQWFFNLADNSATLDYQNGGSTVFGQVFDKSMAVIDAIAALPRKNAGGALNQLPIATKLTGTKLNALLKKPLTQASLVTINSVTSNHANVGAGDSDRIFAYMEAAYPQYFSPANALSPSDSGSVSSAGTYYRYYSATKSYIATANGSVYYKGPSSNNLPIVWSSVLDALALAVAAGY